MIDTFIGTLSADADGRITRRQTTFWEVVLADSGPYRIHFWGKHEFFFHGEEFHGFAMYADHPLLMDYVEEWRNVYIASAVQNTEALISKLSRTVADLTKNWRSVYRYFNSGFDTRALLQSGNGLLLAGPHTIVDGVSPLLVEHGVTSSILKGRPARGSPRVLIIGSSFIVAESFELKALPPNRSLEPTV